MFWFFFCGMIMVINMFLYDKVVSKPKTVKGGIGRIAAYIMGGIPIVQIILTLIYIMRWIINIVEDNDPEKWYNKPL